MSNPKQYTAKDIDRYHQGGMTAAEMHQLEKAALDDPMLADALEGYRFSKAPDAERASLQSRLQQRIDEEKNERRTLWMQPWMRVAALVLLMAGAGWLVIQTFSTRETDLATRTPALHKEERQAASIVEDSAPTVLKQSPSVFSIDSNTKDVASQNNVRAGRNNPAAQEGASTPVTNRKLSKSAAENDAEIKQEIADAAQASPQNEVATLKAPTPPALMRQQIDSNANNRAMNRRRAAAQESTARKNQAGLLAADSLAQPETGWKAFEEYIAKNRKPVLPLNKKQAEESSVELQFEVSLTGRPVNIVVTQPRNKELNEEAIRLLKEGPAWKGKTGKVKILFPY
jgi:hypothetical protein